MTGHDAPWIADYDQKRAAIDEYLDWVVKVAQERAESRMDTFLGLRDSLAVMAHQQLAAVAAAAVQRLGEPP